MAIFWLSKKKFLSDRRKVILSRLFLWAQIIRVLALGHLSCDSDTSPRWKSNESRAKDCFTNLILVLCTFPQSEKINDCITRSYINYRFCYWKLEHPYLKLWAMTFQMFFIPTCLFVCLFVSYIETASSTMVFCCSDSLLQGQRLEETSVNRVYFQ